MLIEEVAAVIKSEEKEHEVRLFQVWSIRKNRLVKKREMPEIPLVTGQRVLDTLFPLAKGGTACIPGPFGSGKTVVQHQLAKWSDAQIIVFVACGERGNEVADLLLSFPKLKDPSTGRPLMERTIIIANTSNMPVAAREASIYTGMTIAEYFRDMGYSVALMADSSSRWAEALREISGRMEEMPGEEGYPAYLASRIAEFYERAGKVICLGSDNREGALSVIGAVSPPGGDLSDPVVQSTLKVVKVFWALDDKLANMRHFPAINWLNSYSLYAESIKDYWDKEIAEDFSEIRQEAMKLLAKESELQEIARLVGVESLSDQDRLVLESSKSIREDFLHQNAFHPQDTYTSLRKQYLMMRTIIHFHNSGLKALKEGINLEDILKLEIREKISKMKFLEEKGDDPDVLDLFIEINNVFKELLKKKG
jgi:V/A-type H+-transporting ATPase subunit A